MSVPLKRKAPREWARRTRPKQTRTFPQNLREI